MALFLECHTKCHICPVIVWHRVTPHDDGAPEYRPRPSSHRSLGHIHKLTCPDCGAQTRAKLPDSATWSHFGPNVSALAITLRADSRLSITRVQALLGTVFGFWLSRGAISAIDVRASELLAPVHEEFQREVAKADVVHMSKPQK